VHINKLPSAGEDPLSLFTDKSKENTLAENMKDKYDTHRGAHRLEVSSISDDTVRFAMQVLACKLSRKFRKDQVPGVLIETIEKCITRVQMN
jgi:hypothetical protein